MAHLRSSRATALPGSHLTPRGEAAGRDVPAPPPDTVLIVSGSVGAGHDGAANELARRLRERGVRVEQRDHLEALPRIFQRVLQDGYTLSVGYVPAFFEWLFCAIEHRGWVQRCTLAFCHGANRVMRQWVSDDVAVIVSTYPLASQALGRLKATGQIRQPVVTYLTDPAVHRLWVHPDVEHHLTVTAATATQGRERYGVAMCAVGALVPPRFGTRELGAGRADLRAQLGVAEDESLALLVSGSLGLGDLACTVRALRASDRTRVLVLCGRNDHLRRKLSAIPGVVALGWREDVAELMAAADVLVHNAGGLSLTEGLAAGLPAITYQPLPGHGRANAALLARSVWPRGRRHPRNCGDRCDRHRQAQTPGAPPSPVPPMPPTWSSPCSPARGRQQELAPYRTQPAVRAPRPRTAQTLR